MKIEKFKKIPRLGMSLLPTPLQRLENISRFLSANIYCKRDDLTGFAFGGNKTRKLDYLIKDALDKGYDTIVGVGANQSNFCRMASAAGAVNGMDVHLVLGGREPGKATGNLLLDKLFGAKIIHIDSRDWDEWEGKAEGVAESLVAEGKKVYRLPIGGSTPVGALGYVNAFFEKMDWCRKYGIEFDIIMHASSSAGTQAGLLAGKSLYGWPGSVVGIGVAKTGSELAGDVRYLYEDTCKTVEADINLDDIIVDDRYMGEDYGSYTPECEDAIKLFARYEGILLDRVYSGKAAAAVLDYAMENKEGDKKNILFIHTGGNVELFA